jgi:signal peptidase I
MLPNFHSGDLVLLRQESSYHVGEVAGYHNSQLHAVVMHRIVAVHNGRYYFKGDNNNFVDPFHPTQGQLVGAEWIHLPGAGRYVQYARVPMVAAVLAAVLWLLSFRSRPTTRRRRRRHRNAQ